MFERIRETEKERVRITVNGQPVDAWEGEPLAGALLAAGFLAVRETAISAAPRGPYCMMGVCFECRVTIDGVADVQSCLTPVRDGMVVEVPDRRNGEAS